MGNIAYVKGDATKPLGIGNKIIVHVCNDIGGWGKGFVVAISRRWKSPEINFRNWYKSKDGFVLGAVQFVQVEENLWIANLIGQHDIKRRGKQNIPIRYEAIAEGMQSVVQKAKELNASVHMPRIGCGLAGGKWENIELILEQSLLKNHIKTTVYDFE
ncbi:macro domain-containing protein [Tenacibaculum jejuense]|uniref:Macro domain-containing protein n=1 Tax=Tenacibaculum jejuense TaxID=584609 RepID=A0A238UAB1_9FLAO|nr:macro domain-containing protein [Tenacibaculum jejuense]SNR16143.1 protein of unknown function [Tenacibaculum jejuense]